MSENILWGDLETYCEIPITNGTHAYAEGVEVMLFAWAINDEPVNVWDITAGGGIPHGLYEAIAAPETLLYFHNSHFDRTVLRYAMPRLAPPVERWRDTMVQALAHGLPGSLGELCEVLGVPQDKAKDKEGKALIQLFCKPRPKNSKLRRATSKTHPEEWRRFVAYAGLDIEAMREVYNRLPKWNYQGTELALWHRDQQINDRGVCMDMQLARAAIEAVDQEQKRLAKRTQEMTDGEVQAATQRDALIKHIVESYGVELPDMQRSTLERRIADPDLPSAVKELLAIRLQASTTSTSKYKALMKGVSHDGRLRGTLQFCGASRTGRWAGRLFQPQNLPRPSLKQEQIDEGIEAPNAAAKTLKCLQIASGAVYTDDAGSWSELHDTKLQALDSILTEAAGAPVLVAYHWKHDLERLLKAFPRGRHLDQDPQTLRDWNSGKIPVLFAHPASAGHGLNMQDGGYILVFFSHWWDLEQYQQIIERIGPTRQIQAGHNRPVFIHHIIAADTMDEMVMEQRNSKRTVQDILLDAMKKRGIA
ncbi:hypothetical protein CUA56_14155 [Shigella boydii]|nr:hypothetical protein CUA56_14155 [Shigella boydii]